MGRKKKVYSEEEQYIREQKKDANVSKVVKCKGCKQLHPLLGHYGSFDCPCGKKMVIAYSVNHRSAEVLFERE